MNFQDQNQTKKLLLDLLDGHGGRCSVRTLKNSYKVQHIVNVGDTTFLNFLKKFPDDFYLRKDETSLIVESLRAHGSPSQSNSSFSPTGTKAKKPTKLEDWTAEDFRTLQKPPEPVKMLSPYEFQEMLENIKNRPSSPAASLFSIKTTNTDAFEDGVKIKSTPLPSEAGDDDFRDIDFQFGDEFLDTIFSRPNLEPNLFPEVSPPVLNDIAPDLDKKTNFDESLPELTMVNSSISLEQTIKEFYNTPEIVKSTNPFVDPDMPALVRIPSDEVFEVSMSQSLRVSLDRSFTEFLGDSGYLKNLKNLSSEKYPSVVNLASIQEPVKDPSLRENSRRSDLLDWIKSQRGSNEESSDNPEEEEEKSSEAEAGDGEASVNSLTEVSNDSTQASDESKNSSKSQNDEEAEITPTSSSRVDSLTLASQDLVKSPPDNVFNYIQASSDDEDVPSYRSGIDNIHVIQNIAEADDTSGSISSSCSSSKSSSSSCGLKSFVKAADVDDAAYLEGHRVVRDTNAVLTPQEITKDKEFVFYFSEVYSPVHFWFHHDEDVNSMQEQLFEDYSTLAKNKFAITSENIKKGLLVACYLKNFGSWNRALVVDPPNDEGLTRLLFPDFGTVGLVHKKNIKYLLEKYLMFPKYGNRGRLVNLMPATPGAASFSHKEVAKIHVKFSNKKLKAKVVRHNEIEDVYELEVFYNNTKGVEANARDWCIKRNIAAGFELEQGSIYPACYYFPTFKLLEDKYPAFHEQSMKEYHEGIKLDLLLETNYLSCIDEHIVRNPKFLAMMGLERFKQEKMLLF